MQNNNKLIGAIDTQEQLSVRISQDHFSDLDALVRDYGWIGQGFGQIVGNKHIGGTLKRNGIEELTIDQDGVHGLEKAPEAEQRVLEELLMAQYKRSVNLVDAVKRGDFERYDAVNEGAIKGLLVGIGVAAMFDIQGMRNSITEMLARLGAGILESSSVSHHVFQKEEKIDIEMPLRWRLEYLASQLASDVFLTLKRIPAGIYSAINLWNFVDKARGRVLPKKVNESLDKYLKNGDDVELPTNTEVWSHAQESAPYRGALGLVALRQFPFSGVSYNFLDALAVFWVNSGNNIQGLAAVRGHIYKNLPNKSYGIAKKALHSAKELASDPFQLANMVVLPVWYFSVLALRSHGIRPEEYGNVGAAIEASLIGIDTAVAAQFAKWGTRYNFTIAPYLSELNPRLLYLANKHGADELTNSLKSDYTPTGFITYRGGRLTINTYRAIGSIAEKVSQGATTDRSFLHRILV